MLRPLYILCCESGSIDRFTQKASHFNILEQLHATAVPDDLKSIAARPTTDFTIFALWIGEDEDLEQQFDYVLSVRLPGDEQEHIVNEGDVTFTSRRHRFIGRVIMGSPKEQGTILVESRIRRKGQTEWLTQTYPVDVSIKRVASEPDSGTK